MGPSPSTDILPDILGAIAQRGPRDKAIASRPSDVVEDLFEVALGALNTYADGFAKRLRDGDISQDCIDDIVKLGITPDQWADTLDNLSIRNGVGSREAYYEALPVGSLDRQVAQQRGLTVGGNFSQGSGTTAISSANDNRVWIDPRRVNPGDRIASSALVAHEALHKLNLLDGQIQRRLGLPDTASVNISEKLGKDCFSGPAVNLLP